MKYVLPMILAASGACADPVRFASFNASLNRDEAGLLAVEMAETGAEQPSKVAQIIQTVRPHVILLNEYDVDLTGQSLADFQKNYLEQGDNPISYPHVYVADSNTGVISGFDLNGDGAIAGEGDVGSFAYAGDSHGFGQFPGQYGFVILSMHPIATDQIRSFQKFKWADMPGGLVATLGEFYGDAAEMLRLSSKAHVDVPVVIDGKVVHVLAAHPTPPVFDGPEDRNGKRNHDEIRLWADYVAGADYLVDDAGQTGGLAEGEAFVILGDYNADPFDGDSYDNAILQLLENPLIQGSTTEERLTPASRGGLAATMKQQGANLGQEGNPHFDTADFGFDRDNPEVDGVPGNLRVDYALPSVAGLDYLAGGVFWMTPDNPDYALAEWPTSDHRLVWVDVEVK